MNKLVSKISAAVTACTLLLGIGAVLPEQSVEAASTAVVDISKEYQTIRGFGGINHPEWTADKGGDLNAAQRQTAFGNGDDELGLTILRVFVNPDKNQWNKALPTAQYATKKGDVTIFASPWEPPANLAESGGSNGKLHIPKSNYAAYAQHLNNFGTYMKDNGVDLYSISVQNEPDYASEWTYWSTDETTDFIANYGDKITSTRLMSPESFQYAPENASWVKDGGKKFYKKILNNSKAMANCDVFGTHFYGTARDWMDFPELENSGKEIWMTEVYVPNSDANSANRYPEAIQVAENIHNAMVVGNMSVYTWWTIRRSYGLMTDDGKISKRGYCMAQYSKYVRPGSVRVDVTEQPSKDVFVSAYKNSGKVTIVAINKSETEYTQEFSLKGKSISNVDRYRTSANENLAKTANLKYSGDGFFAQLPANSVSTFVVSLGESVEPTNPTAPTDSTDDTIKPNKYGWYFADGFEGDLCDWNSRGAAEIQTSGKTAYVGSESLLIQNRTASWNGAAKKLNPKAFVPGKEYSFSANVMYFDGNATDKFFLKLQYTDAEGETHYSTIAEATAVKGEWVQLANKNFKIPSDASDMQIYVETEETTINFYVDEVIGAIEGTTILGAGESKIIIIGDIDFNGTINVFDFILAKRGFLNSFDSKAAETAADVDQSGKVDITDIQLISDFLVKKITKFPVAEKVIDIDAMESIFKNLNIASSYKKEGDNNPLFSQRYGADPGVMEYNGRVYVYMTNDIYEYNSDGSIGENTFSKINQINCLSSDDMVNWTDHGIINVAGPNGAAKWANNSWAPCAAHKKINGKEKFFLYFCNNASSIGVLTSDSPTGPWKDELGGAIVTKSTPNCADVAWLFDPAVMVDDDGTGYLAFGGGNPNNEWAHPKTARIAKLSEDMLSLDGTPVTIDAPYLFEDGGINKIGDKYYYTYCSNFNTNGNPYGLSGAAIQYMVSDNPLGPYTYSGQMFKSPGDYIGGEYGANWGNNHHSIVSFNGQNYLFYHARTIKNALGIKGDYRSPQVDKITVNGTDLSVTGTMTGVAQVKALDPYKKVQAETMSNQSDGISVSGLDNTIVKGVKGSWIKVSGVDFSNDAKALTVNAASKNGAVIKVCSGSITGTAIAYVEIPAGSSMSEITVPTVNSVSENKDIYFVFSGDVEFDSWSFK